ncbi:MAG: hypothetical protein KDJ72_05045 [Methyloceanibacter sp.]|uniref:hypothetical protein n=1 Tax=Methyloceanibacter sp. TaxID=1965321 RepID=UPI001D98EA32|nr:hypothetical protein [Methyloceanibacter sp.]MCB1442370.1 hypothetical protein [Methyloceanibacter sp.]
MKKIASFVAVSIAALSIAGCAVEVPLSAFRMGPPDPVQNDAAKAQLRQDQVQRNQADPR